MFRNMARKPIARTYTYLKYGFVVTESEKQLCPRCGSTLNAGPDYQPRRCGQCGQRIDYSRVEWKGERTLGFAEGGGHEPIKDRVV
ncbi:hypothetical protein [Acetatifactor aquisgranensis]|uniref:hypothetical protein n=1 Tax=Acetatifactor aquisgranensis TaxID=2941233 RepID=UPI002040F87D|nr:hypothetical protein [Acetatifactor aquisgranensis]